MSTFQSGTVSADVGYGVASDDQNNWIYVVGSTAASLNNQPYFGMSVFLLDNNFVCVFVNKYMHTYI